MPRGWSSWRFWQFGQFRFGNGLPRLDGNVYAADVDRLGRERQRIMRLEGGAEWASAQEVRADLRGYHGKDVRVALDDETFGAWRPFEPALGIDLGRAQGARRVRVQLRSFDAVCRLVECNVGIGVVPETTVERNARTMTLNRIELTDEWALRRLTICVRKLKDLPTYAQELVRDLAGPAELAAASG